MCRDCQLLRQVTVAEDLDQIEATLGEAPFHQLFKCHNRATLERCFQRGDVDFSNLEGELIVVEAALGDPTKQGRLPPFVGQVATIAGPAFRPFVTATGGLAVSGTDPAADAFTRLLGMDSDMNVVDHHD